MILKADIIRENRKLTSNLKIAQKTVATLTKENRALRAIPKVDIATVDSSLGNLQDQITDRDNQLRILRERLKSCNEIREEVIASSESTRKNYIAGRTRLYNMSWFKRLFLSRNNIRIILLNGKL